MAEGAVPGMRRLRRLLWGPVLFALWLLFAGEASWLVAIWGIGGGLMAMVGVEAVVRRGLLHVRGQWRWIRELGPAAIAVPVDFLVITAALFASLRRRRRDQFAVGGFRRDESAEGDEPIDVGRRAWVTTVATWSPNCYVIDIASDSGRRLIHDLHPRRASELPR